MATEPISEKDASNPTNKFITKLSVRFSLKKVVDTILIKMESLDFQTGVPRVLFVEWNRDAEGSDNLSRLTVTWAKLYMNKHTILLENSLYVLRQSLLFPYRTKLSVSDISSANKTSSLAYLPHYLS